MTNDVTIMTVATGYWSSLLSTEGSSSQPPAEGSQTVHERSRRKKYLFFDLNDTHKLHVVGKVYHVTLG